MPQALELRVIHALHLSYVVADSLTNSINLLRRYNRASAYICRGTDYRLGTRSSSSLASTIRVRVSNGELMLNGFCFCHPEMHW